MKLRILGFFASWALMPAAWAAPVIPIEVLVQGNAAAATELVEAVHQRLQDSTEFQPISPLQLGMRLGLSVLDGGEGSPNLSYAATWAWRNPDNHFLFLLDSELASCAKTEIEACADGLLRSTLSRREAVLPFLISVPE